MSTLSREENTMVMSSEGSSSSCPDEAELELSLGLSLGGARPGPVSWDHCCAKDFSESSSSSSSSSSAVHKAKPSSIGTQVAGWPPIGTYRLNSLVNNAKSPATVESASTDDNCKTTNAMIDKTNFSQERCDNVAKERGLVKKSLFVKVNMDGVSIGRKIDLNAHSCYETLARMLDHMFALSAAVCQRRLHVDEHVVKKDSRQSASLLDGSSDFVLTYEDKDGDWMLVGDVPWEMFLSSVRRLRIRRTSEANGLDLRSHERHKGQLKATR